MGCGTAVAPDSSVPDAIAPIDAIAADAADSSASDVSATPDVHPAIDVVDDRICIDRSNVDHCGPSCARCPERANATRACVAERCAFTCEPSFADCDAREDNGCEADTRSDALHCGACDARCDAPANGSSRCDAGRCEPSCDAGFVLRGAVCERIPVRPLYPQSTEIVRHQRPDLRWIDPGGVDEFELVLSDHLPLPASGVRTTATSLPWPAAVSPTAETYFWQVRAFHSGSEVSRSAVWTFRTTPDPASGVRRQGSFQHMVDLDGDGSEEFILPQGRLPTGGLRWFIYRAMDVLPGVYTPSTDEIATPMGSDIYPLWAAGDINGDGCADLASHSALVLGARGAPPVVVDIRTRLGPNCYVKDLSDLGDLDRDGYADMLLETTCGVAPGASHVAFGSSAAIPIREIVPIRVRSLATPVASTVPTDIDSDGFSELTLYEASNQSEFGSFRWNQTDREFQQVLAMTGAFVGFAGDLNGDGYLDRAGLGIFLGARPGMPGTGVAITLAPGLDSFRGAIPLGDANHDGFDDFVTLQIGFPDLSRTHFVVYWGDPDIERLRTPDLVLYAPAETSYADFPQNRRRYAVRRWNGRTFFAITDRDGINNIYEVPSPTTTATSLSPYFRTPASSEAFYAPYIVAYDDLSRRGRVHWSAILSSFSREGST